MLKDYEDSEEETEYARGEGTRSEQGEEKFKDPEISINAMEGTTSPKALRFLGLVNKKPVCILIDTGSTH